MNKLIEEITKRSLFGSLKKNPVKIVIQFMWNLIQQHKKGALTHAQTKDLMDKPPKSQESHVLALMNDS